MLTLLLACSDDKPAEPAPAPDAADLATPAPPPPAAASVSKAFALDAPGGVNGAPEGMNFVVPAGTQAEVVAGPLSDGSTGVRLTAKAAGDALVCTLPFPTTPQLTVRARMKVAEVQPGSQPWQGMNVELRSRDDGGALVQPQGSRYTLIRNERAAGDWAEVENAVAQPPGATKAEVCFRFVNSTGTVEIDKIEVGGAVEEAAAAPAPEPVVGATANAVRFDLDAPGGGSGAPTGADFFVPPGTPGVETKVGDVDGGTGFSLTVTQPGNALACTSPFPTKAKMVAKGRVRVRDVKSDGRPWTGFAAEVRTYDAAGALVSPAGTQFVPLRTWKAAGDWAEFTQPFEPPAAAANGKVCLRFPESTGAADVDWIEVAEVVGDAVADQ